MSLLEEILSSIKRESPSGDVPPNLKRLVSSSMAKQRTRKRTILISIFAIVMVGIGYGAILFFETVPSRMLKSDNSKKVLQALQGLKTETLQTQSNQPAATSTSPQSPPLPPTRAVEPFAPVRPSAGASLEADKQPVGLRENKTKPARSPGPRAETSGNSQGVVASESAGKAEKDLHLYTAKGYEGAGDLGKALTEYKKALEWDRENHLILNNIAGVLIRLGLYQDAGVYAERALAARKDYIPSLVNLAVARLKSGEPEEGMKYLSRALQLAPTDRTTLSNLALLCEKNGEYGKSYDLYRRLAAMDDMDGHLGMARVCEKENRAKEAEAIYRNILKRDPDKRAKKIATDRLVALGLKE
jgi:Flp pilus assembly protein TadD